MGVPRGSITMCLQDGVDSRSPVIGHSTEGVWFMPLGNLEEFVVIHSLPGVLPCVTNYNRSLATEDTLLSSASRRPR